MPVPVVTIDATGITVPSFEDIQSGLISDYQGIYGSDAFLDPSSQDFQWITAQAQAISDTCRACAAVFNSFSPATAQGSGLSRAVKINGLRRLASAFSQADLTIGGTVGSTIINGLVGDNQNGNTQWLLPTPIIIPASGLIVVTAVCAQEGAIAAPAGTLTRILNPQKGWQTVTNLVAASLGVAAESDAELRIRQAASTALPAQTPRESIEAAIANIQGVGRVRVYENNTAVVDGNGIPANSIAAVVDGGSAVAITNAIALKKAPGIPTFGSISQNVTDSRGVSSTIHFFPLSNILVDIVVTIKALAGYTSSIGNDIVSSIVNFENSLDIGENSYLSRLYTPANLGGTGEGAAYVVTGLTQARHGNPQLAQDVNLSFNEAVAITASNVTLIVT